MLNFYKKIQFQYIISVLLIAIVVPYSNSYASPVCAISTQGTVLASSSDYVGDVTSILHGNCNAYASIEDDNNNPLCNDPADRNSSCSCEGNRNLNGARVDVNSFTVTVQYKKGAGITDSDQTCNLINSGSCGSGPTVNPVTIVAELEGDLMCVYAQAPFYPEDCGVPVRGSVIDENEKLEGSFFGIGSSNGLVNPIDSSLPFNCIPVPLPPPVAVDMDWGDLISDVCTEYDSSSSMFRYPDGSNRAFTGVVIECIEETMSNLFDEPILDGGTLTIYESFVEEFTNIIRALLVLYVMVFGYPYIYGKRGIGTGEWHWFALKVGLVVYFAIGTGMADFLPSLQNISKSASLIVLEASSGDLATAEAANEDLNPANPGSAAESLLNANNLLIQARRNLANGTGTQGQVNAAMSTRNDALDIYDEAKFQASSYGYRYCDFRVLVANTGTDYPADKEYMRLWDMIDCKISKVLGIGDNVKAPRSPHLLLLTIASIFTNIGIGFVNFILAVIVTVFTIMLIIRIVHVYIMASMGLVLLAFIGPLIIPSVLFNFTKNIFDGWLSQIIAYVVQPVILFAFLGFLFAAMDMAMYEGNHTFVPMEGGEYDNRLCMKWKGGTLLALCSELDFNNAFNQGADIKDFECEDPHAMGCVVQKVAIKKERSNHLGLGLNNYFSTISFKDAKHLFIGLIQMVLVCYLAFAVLGLVEEMSVTLTNAAGGGAVSLSRAPKLTPHKIGQHAIKPFSAVAGATVGRSVTNALERRANRRLLEKDVDAKKKNAKVEGAAAAKSEIKENL